MISTHSLLWFSLTLVAGFFAVLRGNGRLVAALALGLAVVFVWYYMDGFANRYLAKTIVAPACLGAALGGAIGWLWTRRSAKD